MPIVLTPIPGSTPGVGWGVQLHAQSDFIGPLPNGSHWNMQVATDTEFTRLIGTGNVNINSNPVDIQIGPKQTDTGFGNVSVTDGTPVQVMVKLFDNTGAEIDSSGAQQFTWETTSRELPTLTSYSASSSGGLTTQEHDWLDRLQQTIANTVAYGGTLATQVLAGGIFEHPAMGLLQPCDPVMRLTGEGILSRPAAGVGVEAYGLVLTTPVSPPGAGLLNGSLVQWTVRTIQLSTWHRASNGSTLYPTELLNLQVDTFAWTWRNSFPQEIHFSVTPGFEIDAQWLCWIINP